MKPETHAFSAPSSLNRAGLPKTTAMRSRGNILELDGSIAEVIRFASTQVSRTLMESALVYASRRWAVFPVQWVDEKGFCSCADRACDRQGKHPFRGSRGLKDATTDEAIIRKWWTRYPKANIGIATGAVSRLVVIDVDPEHGGEESLARLIAEHGALDRVPEVRTGGGGRHLYFRHPGVKVPTRGGKLGPGLDVRGDGGYAIAPPSRNAKGRYVWV